MSAGKFFVFLTKLNCLTKIIIVSEDQPSKKEPIEIGPFELPMCQLQIKMFKIKWVCNTYLNRPIPRTDLNLQCLLPVK